MVRIAEYDDDFYENYRQEKRKIIVYGAGYELRKNFHKLPEIDLICDRNAKNIVQFQGIKVLEPDKLKEFDEHIYIIVCVREYKTFVEICNNLRDYQIEAKIFYFFNNISFGYSFWSTARSYQEIESLRPLSVNIVCQDNSWIFKKFADRMCEYLSKYDVDVSISCDTKQCVNINHHIPFIAYEPYDKDTLMITHVDNAKKLALLKKQLQIARMGICMSKETMNNLVACGLPRERLCYINPAHDNVIKPHKYVISITNRCYDSEDVRKRATTILDILNDVNPLYFRFCIMGSGWNEVVKQIEQLGFEVEYYSEFVNDIYNSLMQKTDYFLYMGVDEGAMGYLDALAAGAGTIVTPQGYHLDTDYPIDYACSTVKQFRAAFLDLQKKKEARVKAVSNWTWDQYVLKHLEVWNYLLKRKSLKELYSNQSCYLDGIFSVMPEDNRV